MRLVLQFSSITILGLAGKEGNFLHSSLSVLCICE